MLKSLGGVQAKRAAAARDIQAIEQRLERRRESLRNPENAHPIAQLIITGEIRAEEEALTVLR